MVSEKREQIEIGGAFLILPKSFSMPWGKDYRQMVSRMHKQLSKHQSWQIVAAGDIFPGGSNGFLNSDLSPMHFEEEGDIINSARSSFRFFVCFVAQTEKHDKGSNQWNLLSLSMMSRAFYFTANVMH